MKDDIHVANVISPTTAGNRRLHNVVGIDPIREHMIQTRFDFYF